MKASQQQQMDEWMTVKDVMKMLQISKSSVYRLVQKRVLQHYKPRFGLRFKRADVRAYLERCCVEAINDENIYGSKKTQR